MEKARRILSPSAISPHILPNTHRELRFNYTVERFGTAQARRVADAIYETAASLQDMPNRGREGRKPDTREMLISGFPFVIIYRVGQEAVEISVSCILRSNGLN